MENPIFMMSTYSSHPSICTAAGRPWLGVRGTAISSINNNNEARPQSSIIRVSEFVPARAVAAYRKLPSQVLLLSVPTLVVAWGLLL